MASDAPPRFLLLLPPPPSPLSLSSLKDAFGDTLTEVLKEVFTHSPDSNRAAILEVALSCPELVGKQEDPRANLYDTVQTMLARIYKLVCMIAAQESLDVEDEDGVDVRVLLLAWSPDSQAQETQRAPFGPIIDLQTLASSPRQWEYAFGVESEAGEALVKAFVDVKGSGEEISRVHSETCTNMVDDKVDAEIPVETASNAHQHSSGRRHYHAAVGGTFDHLHIGHKLLLTMTVFAVDVAAAMRKTTDASSATVGITGDQLLINKKYAEFLQGWEYRQKAVESFIDSIVNFSSSRANNVTHDNPGPNGHSVDLRYANGLTVKCVEIQDPFGPTITEEHISALIISAETRSGGKAVNERRKAKGWAELEVFEVDVLDIDEEGRVKEGFESKISSTAIRDRIAKNTARKNAA